MMTPSLNMPGRLRRKTSRWSNDYFLFPKLKEHLSGTRFSSERCENSCGELAQWTGRDFCYAGLNNGGLVIRSRLRDERVQDSKSDSKQDPQCIWAWCILNLTSSVPLLVWHGCLKSADSSVFRTTAQSALVYCLATDLKTLNAFTHAPGGVTFTKIGSENDMHTYKENLYFGSIGAANCCDRSGYVLYFPHAYG
ncbi:hypothetical protein AVEN_145673-1 [Araneus ventricosus]|uniref:Uncharacterized protein n=1 Tax=Araneus ventricosus TaxID=182803 RepID=A0A4Y2RP59_ARAVE|nr:hypothetical protein AVEN_145673-1 [Araneus ventricosus]